MAGQTKQIRPSARARSRRDTFAAGALAALLGTGAVATSAAAQSTIGRVRDAGTRHALAGVDVTLLDSAGHAAAGTTTDGSGNFYLDASAPGRYALAFTWAGGTFTTASRSLARDQEVQSEYLLLLVAPTSPALAIRKPAAPWRGNPVPQYPESARGRGMTHVLVQFTVDTAGRADMSTLQVLTSGGTDFDGAVADALPDMRFEPARLSDGRPVRQTVRYPVTFSSRRQRSKWCLPPPPLLPMARLCDP